MKQTDDRMILHIGVTGHRMLPAAHLSSIEKQLNLVLDTVVQQTQDVYRKHAAFFETFFGDSSPSFRLVSSLAEGADTLAAEAALARGFGLLAPIPFGKDEYAADFAEGAPREKYRELLGKAEQVLELAACSKEEDSSQGYADASEIMLCHTDVLIALWDGNITKYKAGTYATLRAARKAHLPVIVIRTDSPEAPVTYCSYAEEHADWQEHVQNHLLKLMLPADEQSDREVRVIDPMLKHWARYLLPRKLRERKDAEKSPLLFPIAERDYKYKGTKLGDKFCDFLCHFAKPSAEPQRSKPQSPPKESLPPVIQTSDTLWGPCKDNFSPAAGYYGKVFREKLFCKYFLPVFCMISVILAINFNNISFGKALKAVCSGDGGMNITTVLFCILGIVMMVSIFSAVLTLTGQNNRVVHGRFTSYRILAERCRNSKFLWSVGFCCVHSPRYRLGPVRWETWYYRLMVRRIGMPSGRWDSDSLRVWLHWLREGFLADQALYHEQRSIKTCRYNDALFNLSCAAYKVGIAMSMLRILMGEVVKLGYIGPETAAWLLPLFGSVTLLCPCVGTFLLAYSAFAGYPADMTASRTMESTFDTLLCDVDAMLSSEAPVTYADALELCRRVDEYCLGDICNWESTLTSNKAWMR